MSQPALPWLTTGLLSSWLGREVTSLSMSAAVAPGNNYGSVVTRVTAQLSDQEDELSLIVKSELTEGAIKDNFLLPTTIEHDFYYKFLPEARKITDTSFAPDSFPIPRPESVLLEDLKVRGFEMADRSEQLDFEHCRLYMLAAAKLHAVSLAVHKKCPEAVESIGVEKLYTEKNEESYKRMIAGGMACLLKETQKYEKFKKANKIIDDVQHHLYKLIVDSHQKRKDLNTINQGDPWITNMMFKYDENRVVKEIKILDFQVLRFASPVNDIVMFIWTSANNDVKTSKVPELYKIYLQNFNENLKNFGCSEVFTEEDFMDNVRKLSPLTMFIVASFLPLILDPEPIDADKLYKEDIVQYYEKYYNENFCRNHIPKAMDQMEQAGVFNYLENLLQNLSR